VPDSAPWNVTLALSSPTAGFAGILATKRVSGRESIAKLYIAAPKKTGRPVARLLANLALSHSRMREAVGGRARFHSDQFSNQDVDNKRYPAIVVCGRAVENPSHRTGVRPFVADRMLSGRLNSSSMTYFKPGNVAEMHQILAGPMTATPGMRKVCS